MNCKCNIFFFDLKFCYICVFLLPNSFTPLAGRGSHGDEYNRPSIDRINTKRGYFLAHLSPYAPIFYRNFGIFESTPVYITMTSINLDSNKICITLGPGSASRLALQFVYGSLHLATLISFMPSFMHTWGEYSTLLF